MEQQQRPASQKLPAGLAGVLNSPDDNRDSAYYSSTDASSKHTSAASGIGLSLFNSTGAGPGFHASPTNKTPSPTTTNLLPQPLLSPLNGSMSVASIVSPTTPGSGGGVAGGVGGGGVGGGGVGGGGGGGGGGARGVSQFDRPQSLDTTPVNGVYGLSGETSDSISRRESVDSRINQGFNDMRLGNSPYASHNQSTASIHNTLQQQRNPSSNNRISNGYQPSAERTPDGHTKTMRVAPAITGPAQSTIARAAEPTKGQAWAFPEEEIQRMPSAAVGVGGLGAQSSLVDSRRSSITDSIASSQFTTESRLPPGQRRLDDGLNGGTDYQRLSNASGEFPAVHHHTLQNKQLADLQSGGIGGGEAGAHNTATQPYSRTPELRVSHKLAERKRRTEMKELFEQLRDLMPQERGSKASKWEILTKAIAEHQRQTETIRVLQNHCNVQSNEIEMLKRELHTAHIEAERMHRQQQQQQQHQHQQQHQQQPPPPPPPQQHQQQQQQAMADPYATDQYGRPRPELPPLRSIQGGGPAPPSVLAPDSMTGVQYEQPRVNGYRPSEPVRY